MKKGYYGDIEDLTEENEYFRKVLYTGAHCQLVLMSLGAGEDIGLEVHEDGDQFFRFEKGEGKVLVNETEYEVKEGDVVIVPAGAAHNVINSAPDKSLKFYTLYAPPHHQDGIVRTSKAAAAADSPEFTGVTTE